MSSNGHAGLRPTNEIQHGFRTGRTGLRRFERRIAVQQRMGSIEERVEYVLVSVVRAADGVDHAAQFIEPFAELPGQRFSGLARPPERCFGDHGSHNTTPAKHLGYSHG